MSKYQVCIYVAMVLLLGGWGPAAAQQPEAEIEHLIKAAAHLQQAGYDEMAADVRQLAAAHDERLKEQLLDAKRAQITALQAEIAQLSLVLNSRNAGPKIELRLRVLHLSMEELRKFGLDLVSIRQLLEPESPASLVDDGGEIVQFLQLLETQGLAEVIAEPALVATDGRPARFHVAGSKPADGKTSSRAAGRTGLECTPTLISGGRVRLEVRFSTNTDGQQKDIGSRGKGAESTPEESTGQDSNGLRDEGFRRPGPPDVRAELGAGQTLILARQQSGPESKSTAALLILVQTEVIQP